MNKPRQVSTKTASERAADKQFVLAALRTISRNMKQIDEVIVTAGIALDRGLISPAGAINMTNGVAPGAFENFMLEIESAEIGIGCLDP